MTHDGFSPSPDPSVRIVLRQRVNSVGPSCSATWARPSRRTRWLGHWVSSLMQFAEPSAQGCRWRREDPPPRQVHRGNRWPRPGRHRTPGTQVPPHSVRGSPPTQGGRTELIAGTRARFPDELVAGRLGPCHDYSPQELRADKSRPTRDRCPWTAGQTGRHGVPDDTNPNR